MCYVFVWHGMCVCVCTVYIVWCMHVLSECANNVLNMFEVHGHAMYM